MILFGGLGMGIFCLSGIIFTPSPPEEAIKACQEAIGKARRADAEHYASEQFLEVEQEWSNLMDIWKAQNQKWWVKRDFTSVQAAADSLQTLAKCAEQTALEVHDSLGQALKIAISILNKKSIESQQQLNAYPPKSAISQSFVRSELLLHEAQSAYTQQNYLRAQSLLNKATVYLGESEKKLTSLLREYKKQIPIWLEWSRQTIAWSDTCHSIALIIDKMLHECYLYQDGHLDATFSVELGIQWMGRKTVIGDAATPEGQYQITQKKDSTKSDYHKALVISYPNEEDLEYFSNLKKRGLLTANASIGGGIEVHGEGNKGYDWTQGCIALRNQDIDRLFDIVQVGTPVTIVGCLK